MSASGPSGPLVDREVLSVPFIVCKKIMSETQTFKPCIIVIIIVLSFTRGAVVRW